VRIAGVFELGQSSDVLHRGRFEAMLATVEPYFADWRPSGETLAADGFYVGPTSVSAAFIPGDAPR
jgi:hypothetical protein